MNRTARHAFALLAFVFVIVALLGSLLILDSKEARGVIWPCVLGTLIGLITYLGFIFLGRRGSDPETPTVVATLSDELSASALVVLLESHGITARAIGGFTAGETISDVRVVVAESEYESAMTVLNEPREQPL